MADNININGIQIPQLPTEDSPAGFEAIGYKSGRTSKVSLDTLATKVELQDTVVGTNLLGSKANVATIKSEVTTPSKGDTYKATDTGHYWKYNDVISETNPYDPNKWVDIGDIVPSDAMRTGGTTKTGAQLDTDITQNGIKLQYGTNRLNPNYTDGFNKGLDTNGNIIASTGWYVTPPIRWDGEPSLLCQRYRLSCQYDASGKFVAGSYNITSSGSTELNITVNKVSGAVYMRMMLPMTNKDISMIVTGTVMPSPYVPFRQVVSADLNGGTTVFKSDVTIDEKLEGWVLSESFKLTSTPTYTDGLLNSTIDVQYPDGGTGTINFTRNSDGLITTLGANHNEQKRRITIILTRDTDGNILTQSITFANIA